MKGAGHQGGEIVETIWPAMKEFLGSTQESSTELHGENLDRHFWDHNWKKMTKIGRGHC